MEPLDPKLTHKQCAVCGGPFRVLKVVLIMFCSMFCRFKYSNSHPEYRDANLEQWLKRGKKEMMRYGYQFDEY